MTRASPDFFFGGWEKGTGSQVKNGISTTQLVTPAAGFWKIF